MNRLKEMRKAKGYTQLKMQILTGIDQSDYSKIENGKRYYTFEQCRKIALALGTSMDYLAGLTDVQTPYPRNESNMACKRKRVSDQKPVCQETGLCKSV
ncbi:MAG: helix-turn-helix domain-containing protein [Lachnospiraceae bacterium]|nr:helix-turn-helix domain-containing protein [Lachnospiraceae bacterium]MCM1239380.1 helix-turn-helix domain-containing protein [Lachnospiraceae bacterium]